MDKYEYKVINSYNGGKGLKNSNLNYDNLEQYLNELGQEGWELVSIAENDLKYIGVYFFKRRIVEKKEESLFL